MTKTVSGDVLNSTPILTL